MSSTLTSAYLICTVKSELKGCGCKQNRPPGYPSVAQHTILKKCFLDQCQSSTHCEKGALTGLMVKRKLVKVQIQAQQSTVVCQEIFGGGGGGQTFSSTKNQ